jgi:hypothetical protein
MIADLLKNLSVMADELYDEIEDSALSEDDKADLQQLADDITKLADEALALLSSIAE